MGDIVDYVIKLSFRGPLEGVGPENQDFFEPKKSSHTQRRKIRKEEREHYRCVICGGGGGQWSRLRRQQKRVEFMIFLTHRCSATG